ncbi:unnamed protein product [Macrosiphum euphorbiae]|uniref:DDE-1 domain-containing protein n=1 Tax=Macrosiphum euphorbiae TaxID=13131 RepID=A0AAV0XQW0_9HEMI|nr:unnamed protein product [Macrosiphum euphorbiae]
MIAAVSKCGDTIDMINAYPILMLKPREFFGEILEKYQRNTRENTSVLMACSAASEKGPPLIIYKGKKIWDKWIGSESLFPGTTYAATNNGWMEKEVFTNYF